jgi:hypothetical protein
MASHSLTAAFAELKIYYLIEAETKQWENLVPSMLNRLI